ncbi:hypothetical protein QJQ45_014172, partial [Haematococcus lacustris]
RQQIGKSDELVLQRQQKVNMCEQAAAVYAETGVKALAILGLDKPDELTKQDLVLFLYAIGLNPTDDVIDSKLRFLKLHQREVITFPQVCHVWHSMLQDLTDEDAILRRAFQYFDKDGNGEISVIELRTTMHELGDLLTESELLSFMQVMDANNDGVIGYQEFLDTLKMHSPDMASDEDYAEEEAEEEEEVEEEQADGADPPAVVVQHLKSNPEGSKPELAQSACRCRWCDSVRSPAGFDVVNSQ